MNPYILIAVLLAGATGGVFGYKATVEATCASNFPDKCPVPIKNAVDALKLKSAEVQIEYRDRIIPVIARDATEDRARNSAMQADQAALFAQERTNACASSPAFVARREQLCAAVGGADCEPAPEAAQ